MSDPQSSTRWTHPKLAAWREAHSRRPGSVGHDLLMPEGADRVDDKALERALARTLKGEVLFDAGHRAIYSHDSSNYRQAPLGVVVPRDEDDVVATLAACRDHGAPVLPRGCGTSLSGETCNVAVVIDASKHMRTIHEVDAGERYAWVQPGVIRDQLSHPCEAQHALTFGPDTATHAYATFGGMLGNNSCGIHSVMAGRTSDNTHELDVVTYDGLRMRVGPTSHEELERIVAAGGRRGEIYGRMRELRDRHAGLIRERYPDIPRRVSGYNLDELLPEKGFNVARALVGSEGALVGSEGTLATVIGAKVRLVHSPPARSLLVLGYPDVYHAADRVPEILDFGPIGLEGIDRVLVDARHALGKHEGQVALPDGNGFLLVEFGGDTGEESHERAMECMEQLGKGSDAPSMQLLDDPADAARLWEAREDGLGATAYNPTGRDQWPGWERIVTDPFEARRVANDGKLAVILGIEVSRLFGCGINNGIPQCDKAQIDRELDEVYDLGVRQMQIINKFDNAFGGVAGDRGNTGTIVNSQNQQETGRFWDMRTCDSEAADDHDREQTTTGTPAQDAIFGAVFSQNPLTPGSAPLYPSAPHCNNLGLSDLGEHVVRRMMRKGMIIDPDHLGVYARRQLLSIVEAERYSGLVSSHTWSTPDAERRILRAGGFVTPYAGGSTPFVQKYRELQAMRDPRWKTAAGFGADANGLGRQGPPRPDAASNPVVYPFKSFDGSVTFERQQSGERTFDINTEGVAHYGLYADWFEDIRKIAGDALLEDMSYGADSYFRTWERAVGITPETCRDGRLRLTPRGMGYIRIGVSSDQLLRDAGQPTSRKGRSWRWCVEDRGNEGQLVRTAFTPKGIVGFVGSTVRRHRIDGVGAGTKTSRIRGARTLARGIRVRNAGAGKRYLYGVGGGKVRWVAVATREASRTRAALRRYVRLAGLR